MPYSAALAVRGFHGGVLRRWASLLLLGLIIGAASPARADNEALAREQFIEGMRRYQLADYGLALEAFKRAYMQFASPAFLFNIAQCHRRLGHRAEALHFYTSYLDAAPDAQDGEEVARIVAELRAEEQTVAPPPVIPPREVSPPAPRTMPVPVAAEVVVTPAAAAPARRWWIWGVAGAAAIVVVVVAAVIVAELTSTAGPMFPADTHSVQFSP